MNRKEIAEMAQMKEQIINLDTNLTTHIKDQREDFDKVFDKLDTLHGKFAAKWVEKVSIGLIISIVGSIILLFVSNFFGG